jgi:hypothetical protein
LEEGKRKMTSKYEWERLSPSAIKIQHKTKKFKFVYSTNDWEGIERIKEMLQFLEVEPSKGEIERTKPDLELEEEGEQLNTS